MKPCRRATSVTAGLIGITAEARAQRASVEEDVNNTSGTHWNVVNVWWDLENLGEVNRPSRSSCSSAIIATNVPELSEPISWSITNVTVWWDSDVCKSCEGIALDTSAHSPAEVQVFHDSDDGDQQQSHVMDSNHHVIYNVWWDEGCTDVEGQEDDHRQCVSPVSAERKGNDILSPRTVLSISGSASSFSDVSSPRSSGSVVDGVLGNVKEVTDTSGLGNGAACIVGKKASLNQKLNNESRKQWLRWAAVQLKWYGKVLEQSVRWS